MSNFANEWQNYVDGRCKHWARSVANEGGKARSVLVMLMEGGVLGSGSAGSEPLSFDVLEVERAVNALESLQRKVVLVQYLGRGNSVENAQAMRMSKKAFFNYLRMAQADIYAALMPGLGGERKAG